MLLASNIVKVLQNAKLSVRLSSASPNQCCHFTSQNEMLAALDYCTAMSIQTNCKMTAVAFKFASLK